eukprot:TRINITY_DN5864_c0_g1_i3.p1 TRINITY_DN5864_c0_g1~~TRINITY_DN5864_c0_g1_i3.p1  ORF type:complete len:504 (+),score=121.57 TRINITY_DN5864_c0_g1_i3:43-1512(+)
MVPQPPQWLLVNGGHCIGYNVSGRYALCKDEKGVYWKRKDKVLRLVGGFWTIGTGGRVSVRSKVKAAGKMPHEMKGWSTSISNAIQATPDAMGTTWTEDATIKILRMNPKVKSQIPTVFRPYIPQGYLEDWCSEGGTNTDISYAYTDSKQAAASAICTNELRDMGCIHEAYPTPPLASPRTASRKTKRQRLNHFPIRSIESFLEEHQSQEQRISSPKRPRPAPEHLLKSIHNTKNKDAQFCTYLLMKYDVDGDGLLCRAEFNKLLRNAEATYVSSDTFDDICIDVGCSSDGLSPKGLHKLYRHDGFVLKGKALEHYQSLKKGMKKVSVGELIPCKFYAKRLIRTVEDLDSYFTHLHSTERETYEEDVTQPKVISTTQKNNLLERLQVRTLKSRARKPYIIRYHKKLVEEKQLEIKRKLPLSDIDAIVARLSAPVAVSPTGYQLSSPQQSPAPPPVSLTRLHDSDWFAKRNESLQKKYKCDTDPWISALR